jgi:hypothetical protein
VHGNGGAPAKESDGKHSFIRDRFSTQKFRFRLLRRAIGWLRIVRSGFGDEAQGFGAVVSVVEEGLVE